MRQTPCTFLASHWIFKHRAATEILCLGALQMLQVIVPAREKGDTLHVSPGLMCAFPIVPLDSIGKVQA